MTMTTVEVLLAAKALLADKKHWCQGSMVREYRLDPRPGAPAIVARCAAGAIAHVAQAGYGYISHPAMTALAETAPLRKDYRDRIKSIRGGDAYVVAYYNDGPKVMHEDVMAWFDRAIAWAKTESEAAVTARMVSAVANLLKEAGLVPVPVVSLADIEDEARGGKRELEYA